MLYLITNRKLVSESRYLDVLKEASFSGVDRIILREKDLDDNELLDLYKKIIDIINPKCNVIINSNINVYKKVSAYGIQLSYKIFMGSNEKYQGEVGVSIHSIEEGIKASQKGCSYILASHIFKTKCKEGLEPKGIEFLKELREKVDIPIVALGGILPENVKRVMECNVDGIAVMSNIMESNNIRESVMKFKV